VAKARETVAVNVKVRQPSGAERAFACPGVLQATRTFPGERDEELARLFVLTVDRAQLPSVLSALRRHPDVELAEEASPRRLIRPKTSS
jgi:hypothetical protein